MKRFLKGLIKWLLILLVLLIVLGFVGIFVAGHVLDSKVPWILGKVSNKVPGLTLENVFTDSSMLSRTGTLYWDYALPKDNPLGVKSLQGATDYKITFGFLKVNAKFDHHPDYGNYDALGKVVGIQLMPAYHGAAEASLYTMTASGVIKTDSLSAPVPDGKCEIGETSAYVRNRGTSAAVIELAAAGVNCKSPLLYMGKSAYDLTLQDFKLKAEPEFDGGKIEIPELNFTLGNFEAEVSSPYMIGFGPDEEVRDRSLRDGFKLDSLQVTVSLTDADRQNKAVLKSRGSGNLHLGFPRVKQGQGVPYYVLNDIAYDFSFERVSLKDLLKAASAEPDELPKILAGALSKDVKFELKNFSLSHGAEKLSLKGRSSLNFNQKTYKPENIRASVVVCAG